VSPLSYLIRLIPLLIIWRVDWAVGQAASKFHLQEGDCVVFYGDSITEQRHYTNFVETYVVTRFPHLNVRFVNSGWSGDRVTGGNGGPIDVRLQRDVFAYKPTVITIMLGMNDGGVRAYDQELFDRYTSGYQHIVNEVKKTLPNVRLTLIQPSPYDDVTQPHKFEGGYNAVLVRYGQFVKELAQREDLRIVDLNTPIVAAIEQAKAIDPGLANGIIPDRVHPAPSGHLLMAAALLRAWKAPAVVAAVEIDAAKKQLMRAEATKVEGLETGTTLTWLQVDDALPMPLDMKDPSIALVVRASDLTETLNQQTLKVLGLTAARYALQIDQSQIGVFTKEELAQGINLALWPTPMLKQAMAVNELTLLHNNMHFVCWRSIQVAVANAKYKSAKTRHAAASLKAALDEEEAEVVKQQHAAAQPVAHRYELSPE
jgi:lysophospholipase L1-like esterase